MIRNAWTKDIPSQFRDKKNISVLIKAFAEELEELEAVYAELKRLTDIDWCEGKNLDTIGTIVTMARRDSYALLKKDKDMVVTDKDYRNVLRYKILQNTSDCTYPDIIQGIRLLWGDYPVHYREDKKYPATYILDLGSHELDDTDVLDKRTLTIRSAGVRVLFYILWIGIIDHSDPVNMLRITASVICKIRIKHYPDVRTWDGSWKLDGSYRLDATQENSARAHYLFSIKNREQIKSPHVYDIPGRLKVTSEDIRVTNQEPAITGIKASKQIALEVKGDYLKITSDGEKRIEDGSAGLKVMGKMERTVWSDDYLVSEQELYGTFKDDGLLIQYAGRAIFELEMQTTYL